MRVATPVELGEVIRRRRRELGWTQQRLADRAGTSRQWVVALEAGKNRVELGLVLHTLRTLNLVLDIGTQRPADGHGPVDLDEVLAAVRRDH